MAELRRRIMALHDANDSDAFEQPPGNLAVQALAVHAAQP